MEIEGSRGVIAIESMRGDTASTTESLTPSCAAVIVVVPESKPVASPAALIVAMSASEEDHDTVAVMSRDVASEY